MSTALTTKEIAEAIQGKLEGNAGVVISGIAGLDEAKESEISFFHNPKYLESLRKTRAAAIIIPEKTDAAALPTGKTVIRVSNPQFAYAGVLGLFDRNRVRKLTGIHPSAVIDPEAKIDPSAAIGAGVVIERLATIGAGSVIQANVYVGERTHVGKNCLVYPNVVFREDTEVGDRVIVHAGSVLGADGYGFSTVGGKHHKIPQIGRVVIEDDVEVGANVTVDRATTGETRIGAGTKIDNLVHIAHNVHIGKNCLIVAQVGISGSTRIGNNVTLAGQVGVVGHLTIGDGAIIAAQSGVMNNVQPGEVLFGSPARPHREAMKLLAIYGKLPELYDTLKELKKKLIGASGL